MSKKRGNGEGNIKSGLMVGGKLVSAPMMASARAFMQILVKKWRNC